MFSRQPKPSSQPPGEAPRSAPKPRPGPGDLERIDAFLGDFLLPMLADAQIDTEEETPLVVAFHAYGIDAFDPWHVLGRAYDRIQFGVPGHSRSFAKAWARIQLHAERMTRNDFLRTREWLQEEGRRAGLVNLCLTDADPGTVFSVASIDRTCIGRFQKLIKTMRVSNLPIAPDEVQPRTDQEPEDAESIIAAAVEAPSSTDAPVAVHDPLAPSAPDLDESQEEEDLTALAEEAESVPAAPKEPDVIDVPASDTLAESVPELAERLRRDAPRILADYNALLENGGDALPGLLFDNFRSGPDNQAVVIDSLPEEHSHLWFLGDIHGDLLALEAALHHMDAGAADPQDADGARNPEDEIEAPPAPPPCLVLLGDLFDDGDHSYEVVLRVLELMVQRPGRIAILAGNHDEALAFDSMTGMFRSSVSPSDFTDWLNARVGEDETIRGVGQAMVRLFEQAPRAFFFPDGLIAAHGGIPLSDQWESLQSPQDLDRPECLQDFVWTRAHPRAKRKIPNRTTRGCEFGVADLNGFCEAASRALGGRPVERMIRGHDHVEERYQLYPKYQRHPLLTINTMSRRLPREVFGSYARVPTAALYRPGLLPLVHRFLISEETVRRVYPEPLDTDASDDDEPLSESRPQALDSAVRDGR